MGKVIVMSGVSGSGKSTYARGLLGETIPEERRPIGAKCSTFHDNGILVSADLFFMVTGEYKLDSSKLSAAHGRCFRDFIHALQDGYHLVVVDNTNTTNQEMSPYMLGAQAFGYEAEVVTFQCESDDDMKVCASRNSHGVPFEGIIRQAANLRMRSLPPWWKNTNIRTYR